MPTHEFDDEPKVKECLERQEALDAIAAYGNRMEFPDVSGSFVREPARPPAQSAPPGATVALGTAGLDAQ